MEYELKEIEEACIGHAHTKSDGVQIHVGGPSVYVLLSLVNKETALAFW